MCSPFTATFSLLFLPPGFPYEKVRERTLYLQVLDYDRFSRNDPIGEVSIPLNKVELGQIKTFWKELKPCSDGSVRAEPIILVVWRFLLFLSPTDATNYLWNWPNNSSRKRTQKK